MRVGLRIDVDTFRGTRYGVSNLCSLLADHNTKGTFFFSVGPDNMGRNLWRLLRPAFFIKILRSKAASLYGWDILFKGAFWPGPGIGAKLGSCIRAAADEQHEIGLHAWDHYSWQTHIDTMSADNVRADIQRGVDALAAVTGRQPSCSAAPGWRCTDEVLRQKEHFAFAYNSDCRGTSIFRPVIDGAALSQLQIPVTLPTYDEVIGNNGVNNDNYNDFILSQLRAAALNVLTIHAEVEGIALRDMFARFLKSCSDRHIELVPLKELIANYAGHTESAIVKTPIEGREGWIARQAED